MRKDIARVVVLLLAGMASALVVADVMDQLESTVVEVRMGLVDVLHFASTAKVSAGCVVPKDAPLAATCSLQVG